MAKKTKSVRAGNGGVAAALRTLRIIEYLADAEGGLSVTEISRRLQVNKSISFRILASLCKAGYVYQGDDNQNYRLTYKISNLGMRQMATSRLIDQSGPILRQLADQTGELVRLAVIEDNKPIWVHAASGLQRRLMIDPIYSHEIISHVHAAGKAWLMSLSDEAVTRILGEGQPTKRTRRTIANLKGLKADLRESRKRGFAMNYEETDVGVGAIAAPIIVGSLDNQHVCVGAISLAAPTSRMKRAALIAAAPAVIKAAAQLADVWPLKPDFLEGAKRARYLR